MLAAAFPKKELALVAFRFLEGFSPVEHVEDDGLADVDGAVAGREAAFAPGGSIFTYIRI